MQHQAPGGGGGAGAASKYPRELIATNNQFKAVQITQYMQNVKITALVGGGAGGGGGYYSETAATSNVKRPKSQDDCNTIYNGSSKASTLLYTGNESCIMSSNIDQTKYNQYFGSTISVYNSETAYNTYLSNPICWSGNTAYGTWNSGINNALTYGWDYWINATHVNACNYRAAEKICKEYDVGTSNTYYGHWRLPTSSEVEYIKSKNPVAYGPYTKGSDTYAPAKKHTCRNGDANKKDYRYNVINYYKFNKKGDLTSDNYSRAYNMCMPEYAWTQDGTPVSMTKHTYVISTWSCAECTESNDYFAVTTWPRKDPNASKNVSGDIKEAAAGVRCAIDYMGIDNNPSTSYSRQGGGGSSGSLITMDANNSNSKVNVAGHIGNYLGLYAGSGGSGGKGGRDSDAAAKGNNGDESWFRILVGSAYNSGYYVQLSALGGKGGGKADSNGNGSAGLQQTQFYHYSYKCSPNTGYDSVFKTCMKDYYGTGGFRFTKGYTGAGVTGATSPASSIGIGGVGGGGYGGTGNAYGGSGQGGYAKVTYDDIYPGGGGGGGGGAAFVKVLQVAVNPGDIITVRVGKGGAGGYDGKDGDDGGITSIIYGSKYLYLYGGYGGNAGYASGTTAVNGYRGNYGIFSYNGFNITEYQYGSVGGSAEISSPYSYGGYGGASGIINLKGVSRNISYPCGGYRTYPFVGCDMSRADAYYSIADFEKPGKLYKSGNKDYGSAGAGGGGGGSSHTTGESGKGADGQNGYVYFWWEDGK